MTNYLQRLVILAVPAALFTAGYVKTQDTNRIIEVHAQQFSFSPSEITIAKDEKITLVLISEDVSHSLVIPHLHVHQSMPKGHPVSIAITSDQTGDFDGMCGTFCGSGHESMRFVVHVRDK